MTVEDVGLRILIDSRSTADIARKIAEALKKIGVEGDKAVASTEKLTTAQKKGESASAKLQRAYEKEVKDLRALQQAQITGKRESEAFLALRHEGIGVESRYGKQLLQTAREYDRLEASQKKVSRGMGEMLTSVRGLATAFGVGLGLHSVTQGLRSIIEVTAEFKQEIANVASITGLGAEGMALLEQAARRMGATTKFTATDAAQSFTLIGSRMPELLGTAEGLSTVTNEVLRFAQASNESLADSATLFSIAMNVYKKDWTEAAEIGNLFAASIQKGAAFVPDLIETLKDVAPIARAAGLNMRELVAAIQILAQGNIRGTVAATALKNTLIQLNTKGIKELETSTNSFGSVLGKVLERQMGFNETTEFFGKIAAAGAITLSDQVDRYEALHNAIEGTNTVSEQMAIQLNTMQSDFRALASAIQDVQISVGEALEGEIRGTTQVLTNLSRMVSAYKELRETQAEHHENNVAEMNIALRLMEKWNAGILNAAGFVFNPADENKLGLISSAFEKITGSAETTNVQLKEAAEAASRLPEEWGEAAAKMEAVFQGPRATGFDWADILSGSKEAIRALGGLSEQAAEFRSQVLADIEALSHLNENLQLSTEELEAMAEVLAADSKIRGGRLDTLVQETVERNKLRKAIQDRIKAITDEAKAQEQAEKKAKGFLKGLERQSHEMKLLSEGYDKNSNVYRALMLVWEEGGRLSAEQVANILSRAESLDREARAAELATVEYAKLNAELLDLKTPADLANEQFDALVDQFGNLDFATDETIIQFEKLAAELEFTGGLTEKQSARIAELRKELIQLKKATDVRELREGFTNLLTAALSGEDGLFDSLIADFQGKFASAISGIVMGGRVPEGGFGLGAGFDNFAEWLSGDTFGASALKGGISGFAASYAITQKFGRGSSESQIGAILAGAGAGSVGGPVGAIIGGIIGALQGGIFTGSAWREIGERMALEIQGGALSSAQGYRVGTRDRAFLGGSQTREVAYDLGSARFDALAADYEAVERAVLEQAARVGISGAEALLATFDDSFTVDLSGLETAEEIEAAYQAAFRDIQSTLAASVVPYLGVFFDTGEEFAAILERLAAEVGTVRDGFDLLGANVDTLIPGEFFEAMERQLHDFFWQAGPGSPVIDGRENFDPMNPDDRGRVQQDQEGWEEFYDEVELLEAARIKYLEEVAHFLGGAEEAAEAFGKIAATFYSTSELLVKDIADRLGQVSTDLDSMFEDLGTSRETFLSDMQEALAAGELTPEQVAAWIEAEAALADLMALERELALARQEALQVTSLTVDQLEALDFKIRQMSESAKILGISLDLSQQAALDAQAAFGSLDAFLQATFDFYDEFLTESEKAAARSQHITGVFADFGLTMEQVAAGGRQLIIGLAEEALAAGDMERYREIITILGPAADYYLDQLEGEEAAKVRLAQETGRLIVRLEDLGFTFGFSADEAERLAESMGTTIDGLGDRLQFVFEQFYSEEEQGAIRIQNAYDAIASAGYNIDYILSLGRDGFVSMLNAALAMGDERQVELLLSIADAVDVVFDSLEEIPDAAGDVAQSFSQMLADIARQVEAARQNIQAGIRSVLASGFPGSGPSGNLTGRIDSLYGAMDGATWSEQIDIINELTGLIVTRYDLERENILHMMEIQEAERYAVTQAEHERLQRLHNEKVRQFELEMDHYRALQSLSSGITGLLGRLETSEESGLSDYALLQLAQSRFFAEALAVERGEGDGANLARLAEQAITLGREIFASSPAGQDIYDTITTRLREVLDYIGGVSEPNDPGELQLPTIAQNTGMTAYYAQLISDAQARATAELDALNDQLAEAQAEGEEEAAAEAERQAQQLQEQHDSILAQEQDGKGRNLILGDILTENEGINTTLDGIYSNTLDLVVEMQRTGDAISGIDIPAQLSESFASAMSSLTQAVYDVGGSTIRALGEIHGAITGLDLNVNITNVTAEGSAAAGDTTGEFIDIPPPAVPPN